MSAGGRLGAACIGAALVAGCTAGTLALPPAQEAAGNPHPRQKAEALERAGKGPDAVAAYRRVARTGDGKAANRLGEIYGKGIDGVEMNYAEHLKWCYTARALGEEPNCARR